MAGAEGLASHRSASFRRVKDRVLDVARPVSELGSRLRTAGACVDETESMAWSDSIDWGSAPDWIAGVGSLGAIAVALWVALTESRITQEAR